MRTVENIVGIIRVPMNRGHDLEPDGADGNP